MKTVVIGLGGNALLSPSGRQSVGIEAKNAAKVASQIAKVAATKKYRIVITHGNGPQIGDELLRNMGSSGAVPPLPFYIMSSETEAQIGTVLELAIRNELAKIDCNIDVATILTHVLVDARDSAFKNPSKPIGPFCKDSPAGGAYKRFSNGYRMVVPSPLPKRILEIEQIRSMKDSIVIACGGGGVPVVKIKGIYKGVSGVIDKDATTQLLATLVRADAMLLLTDVDYVYSDYSKRSGKIIDVRAGVLKKNLWKFEPGTIEPKLKACISFVEHGGKAAYIGSLDKLGLVLDGRSGTRVY